MNDENRERDAPCHRFTWVNNMLATILADRADHDTQELFTQQTGLIDRWQ